MASFAAAVDMSDAPQERPAARIARRGLMLVLSSPSGAGKTTLSRMLLEVDTSVELSVSVTTRPRRANEQDGRDYHFIDVARFEQMVENDELLEWAEVFDNLYGTPRAPVEQALAAGPRRAVRHRLAGHAAAAREGAQRHGQHLRAAAVDRRTGAPPAHARARRRARDQEPHGEGRRRAEPLGGIRLRHRQRRYRPRRSPRCARSCRPSASSASGRPACRSSCAICRRAVAAKRVDISEHDAVRSLCGSGWDRGNSVAN